MRPGPRFLAPVTLVFTIGVTPDVPAARNQSQTASPVQQTPAFRAGVVTVPVDVRVLDRDGEPIRNLTAADFTLKEDGARQEIRQFVVNELTPETPSAGARPPIRDASLPATLTPQNQRVFLIVLGRGRLQEPSMGVDALIRFVRLRLMPQDQVAVLAWNRATDFTTDRDAIVDVLTRFREEHKGIDLAVRQQYSGLGAVYGPRELPERLQIRIDRVIQGAGARTLPILTAPDAARVNADERRTADLLQRVEAQSTTLTPVESELAAASGLTFDEFVQGSRQTMQDVSNIYTGIEYLRQIEGEKHLIFVTEEGFLLPRADDDRSIAAVASDARVAIDTIQTGGTASAAVPRMLRQDFTQRFSISALRTVSERTGGQVSVMDYAETALTRILNATEVGYQLGYTPTNTAWNGRLRTIEVTVNRPGARVLYRRSYFGRLDQAFDRRKYLSYSRILGAIGWDGDIKDIGIRATVSNVSDPSGAQFVNIAATVDADTIKISLQNGQRVVRLDVGIFCGNSNDDVVGEDWRRVDLTLNEEMYQRLLKSGVTFSLRVPVSKPPKFAKLVVYDYDADRLGSVTKRLR